MGDDETVIAERGKAVDSLIRGGKGSDALLKAIESPPFGVKSQAAKDTNADIVARAIAAVPDSEISGIVKSMDSDTCDVMMKYVYRTLQTGQNCATLLKWHALLVEKAGLGTIVRVMADRKAV